MIFRKYLDVVSARFTVRPYFVKWQLAIDQGLPRFTINYLCRMAQIPRVVGIFENLWEVIIPKETIVNPVMLAAVRCCLTILVTSFRDKQSREKVFQE